MEVGRLRLTMSFSTHRNRPAVQDRGLQHEVRRVEDVRCLVTCQRRRSLVVLTLRLEPKRETQLFIDSLHIRAMTAMVIEMARSLTVESADVVDHLRRHPAVERHQIPRWTRGSG